MMLETDLFSGYGLQESTMTDDSNFEDSIKYKLE